MRWRGILVMEVNRDREMAAMYIGRGKLEVWKI